MFIRETCNGCRADSPCYRFCIFGPCSIEHGDLDYCFECDEYPCRKYDGVDEHDSLISHRNQKKDLVKAKRMGIDKYHEEQIAKKKILNWILDEFDDGHRMVFFCLAVNLLDLDDLNDVLKQADDACSNMSLNEKSEFIKQILMDCAHKRNIELELRNDGFY